MLRPWATQAVCLELQGILKQYVMHLRQPDPHMSNTLMLTLLKASCRPFTIVWPF